jgi:hypothetical protein
VKYERDQGVPGSAQRVAREGTNFAIKAYDTKVPDCDEWRVTIDLILKSDPRAVAYTRPHPPDFTITVFTSGVGWFGATGSQKLITMLHEWYHVVEFALFRCPSCRYVPNPPNWLVEGAAVYESYRSANALHIASYSSLRARELYFAKRSHTPLDLLAGDIKTATEYSISFLATEYLVRTGGDRALLDFWNELGQKGYVDGAFRHAFGLSLPAFYKRFQAYRNRGFVGS